MIFPLPFNNMGTTLQGLINFYYLNLNSSKMKKIYFFLKQRKQFLFSFFVFSLINTFFFLNTVSAQTATVATDKLDYLPGEIVHITGSNWASGETVTLQVMHSDGTWDPASTAHES